MSILSDIRTALLLSLLAIFLTAFFMGALMLAMVFLPVIAGVSYAFRKGDAWL